MKTVQEKVSDFVLKNDWLIIHTIFQLTLILLWFEYIFPFLSDDFSEEEPRIILAIAGFVWFSLMSFLLILPRWFTAWTMITIEKTFYLGVKIHKVIR